MASGWVPEGLSESEIADGEAYHRALYIDGDLGRPAGWHRDSVDRLIQLAIPHISEGSTIVDYGSGTGGSAIELLKACLLYTSPSPRDGLLSRMPSSA